MKNKSAILIILAWTLVVVCMVVPVVYIYTAYTKTINKPIVAGTIPPPKSVTVGYGDTLWGIAKKHYPNKDPRRVVYEIQRLNQDIDPGRLRVGQWIDLPDEV